MNVEGKKSEAKKLELKEEDKSKNQQKDDALEELRASRFDGFCTPGWKQTAFLLASILSGGLVFLFAEWIVSFKTWCTLSPCELIDANFAVAHLKDGRAMLVPVEKDKAGNPRLDCCSLRYLYNAQLRTFEPVSPLPANFDSELKATARDVGQRGYLDRESMSWNRTKRLEEMGFNEMVIPVPPPYKLFLQEAMHPFYVFQYFSVVIWCADGYFSYSLIILLITLVSISVNVRLSYTNKVRLAKLAHFDEKVELVNPGGGTTHVSSKDLVAGDLVLVANGVLPCDLVLIQGECVVDENMLTGEAIPIRKVAYSLQADGQKTFDPDQSSGIVLYGGTVVAQAKGPTKNKPCLAMVCRTGFATAKGALLRQILHPKPHQLNFESDALKFIVFMFVLGLVFYLWSVVSLIRYKTSTREIIFKYLDMITVAVPPALAACLTIATTVAIGRLNEKLVFVSQPNVINMAGILDTMCFDKTGTLTEPGLDLMGLVPVARSAKNGFKDPVFEHMVTKVDDLRPEYQELCALCHGLAKLGEKVVGDPLDQKLFAATQWEMEDEAEHEYMDEGATWASGGGASLATLVSSAISGNVAGLERMPPHDKGRMDESWGEFGERGVVEFAEGAGPAGQAAAPAAAPPQFRTEPLDISESGASVADSETGRKIPTGPKKQVASVVLVKPASSWPGFRSMAYAAGVDDSPAALLASHAKTHSVGGDESDSAALLAAAAASAAKPGPSRPHVALSVRSEPRFLLMRRFEFSSEKARMGVLARRPDHTLVFYVKGAPEVVKGLVEPSSLPEDFDGELAKYTREGLRVLGLASLDLKMTEAEAMAADQDTLERGLYFLGFAVMINRLKSDTGDVIGHLQAANLRCAMITGDHIVTGVSIARQCGIIDDTRPCAAIDRAKNSTPDAPVLSFSVLQPDGAHIPQPASLLPALMDKVRSGEWECGVTGHGFAALQSLSGHKIVDDEEDDRTSLLDSEARGSSDSPAALKSRELLRLVLTRGGVFARMSPEGKKAVVDSMGHGYPDSTGNVVKGLGHYVGFCGDGANDLAVLKTALVGVSLCDADASVAAPLTSKNQSISCVIDVVAEGRCSLITAYNIFQFVMVYAFVQVFSADLLYAAGLKVGNYQYLIQDLMYSTVLATVMSLTHPQTRLGPKRPVSRLTSWAIMLPVLVQFTVAGVFQSCGLILLTGEEWYVKFRPSAEHPALEKSISVENTVIFNISLAQLVIAAVVFSKGRPFRLPMYTNLRMVATVILQLAFLVYLVLTPKGWIVVRFAELVNYEMPLKFRAEILLLIAFNFLAAYLAEFLCARMISVVPELEADMLDLQRAKKAAKRARERAMQLRHAQNGHGTEEDLDRRFRINQKS